jgi:hypothetical protein
MWSCPKCHAKIDDTFEVCWSCGTSPGGEEDPGFTHDDGLTLDRPGTFDKKPGIDLDFELAEPEIHLVDCYWARNTSEAMFLAVQLVWEGIPATADTWDLRVVFAGFFGLVPSSPYFGPRVRVLAKDLPRARTWLAEYEERRRARRKCRRGRR